MSLSPMRAGSGLSLLHTLYPRCRDPKNLLERLEHIGMHYLALYVPLKRSMNAFRPGLPGWDTSA